MLKDKVAEALRQKGYDALNDGGIVTVHTDASDREKVKADMKAIMAEHGYSGSWGITGRGGSKIQHADTVQPYADSTGQLSFV